MISKARILDDIPDGRPSADAVGTVLASWGLSGIEIVFAFGAGGASFVGDLTTTCAALGHGGHGVRPYPKIGVPRFATFSRF